MTVASNTVDEQPVAPRVRRFRPRLGATGMRNLGLLSALGVWLAIVDIRHPGFLSAGNLSIIALQAAPTGIASVGIALLIISGNVDLSIGSLFGLAAVLSAQFALGIPWPLAMLAALAVVALLGLANGLIVWRINLSPIIITLAGLTWIRGVVYVITQGLEINNLPGAFSAIGQATFLGLSSEVWVFLVVALAGHVLLSMTTIGRHIYAIGGNRVASATAGINVRRIVLGLFVANAFLAGLAGTMEASRFATGDPTLGIGFELTVITAVILGGVAFNGGEGNIVGVVLGVALLSAINSGLVSLGINSYWNDVVSGLVLIAAVTIDQLALEQRDRYRKRLAMRESAESLGRAMEARSPIRDPHD
jgi:ribose transport system permease protein